MTTVNKWDAERIAEARSVASGLAEVENTDAPVGKETFRFVAFFSGASVLSLLDALEEARHDAEEARALAEMLREEPALLIGYGWEIFQDRSEEAPIIGKARGMLENAWREAASRLDTGSWR